MGRKAFISRSCLVAGLITLPKGLRGMTGGYVVLVSLHSCNLEWIENVIIPLEHCQYFWFVDDGVTRDRGLRCRREKTKTKGANETVETMLTKQPKTS